MTYEEAKKQIAIKHKLGTTLVTGHKASYFEEAALLYADQFKVKNLAQPDVSGEFCGCDETSGKKINGKWICDQCKKEMQV